MIGRRTRFSLFTKARLATLSTPGFARMVATKIDGTAIAKDIRQRIHTQIKEFQAVNDKFNPSLAIIQVGERPDSTSYVTMKQKAAQDANIRFQHIKLPETITEAAVSTSAFFIIFFSSFLSDRILTSVCSFFLKSTSSTMTFLFMEFLYNCLFLLICQNTRLPER